MPITYKIASLPQQKRSIERRLDLFIQAVNLLEECPLGSLQEIESKYGKMTWCAAKTSQPVLLSLEPSLSPDDVKEWLTLENSQTPPMFRNELHTITFYANEPPAKKRAISQSESVQTAVSNLFKALLDRKLITRMPEDTHVRGYSYPETDPKAAKFHLRISPNEDWHIDFFRFKTVQQLKAIFETEEMQCIFTATTACGPRTLILEGVDEIEIPVINAQSENRGRIFNSYIELLIKEGVVKVAALSPNAWYAIDKRMVHRGPRPTDPFECSARGFLHLNTIPWAK